MPSIYLFLNLSACLLFLLSCVVIEQKLPACLPACLSVCLLACLFIFLFSFVISEQKLVQQIASLARPWFVMRGSSSHKLIETRPALLDAGRCMKLFRLTYLLPDITQLMLNNLSARYLLLLCT